MAESETVVRQRNWKGPPAGWEETGLEVEREVRGLVDAVAEAAWRWVEASAAGRSPSADSLAGEVCRICHGPDWEESFISPCKCKGTLARVHRSCLERWLAEADLSSCELCGHLYRTKRRPKYGLVRSVWRYLRSRETRRERRDLLFDLVTCCAFTPVVVTGTYLTVVLTESCYVPPESDYHTDPREMVANLPGRLVTLSVVSLMTTLDLAYASWVLIRLQLHLSQWYSWYRRHSKVFLLSPLFHANHSQSTSQIPSDSE